MTLTEKRYVLRRVGAAWGFLMSLWLILLVIGWHQVNLLDERMDKIEEAAQSDAIFQGKIGLVLTEVAKTVDSHAITLAHKLPPERQKWRTPQWGQQTSPMLLPTDYNK